MSETVVECPSEAAQLALGTRLARALGVPSLVVHLAGDLGAGKTTFVRGYLCGLGHRGAVPSPTFTLVEPYELEQGTVHHLDLYRLADPEELEYLGIRDLLDGRSLLFVEWPERGEGWLPPADLQVEIRHLEAGRRLRFRALTPAAEPWVDFLEQGKT